MKLNDSKLGLEDLQRACFKLEEYLIDRILYEMPLNIRKPFLCYTIGYEYNNCKPEILDDDIVLKLRFTTPEKGDVIITYQLKQISKLFDTIVQDGIEQLKAAGVITAEDKP